MLRALPADAELVPYGNWKERPDRKALEEAVARRQPAFQTAEAA
ncbi:hypothetical protein [Streptomyces sp. QHH-9511]|nr:hypothetical protein [Streptomyces sp. QHH-9511]